MSKVREEAESVLHHAPLVCERHDPVKMIAYAETQAKRVLILLDALEEIDYQYGDSNWFSDFIKHAIAKAEQAEEL